MTRHSYFTRRPSQQVPVWAGSKPLLFHLNMELTERCNNDCRHCYINLPRNDANAQRAELTTVEIQDVIRQAASMGCLNLCFTGGEPLLRDDFEEIYVYSRRMGFRVMIVTNGTLITHRLADLFSRIPPLRKIEISVYGLDRESYESLSRVPGSFEAFQNGMNLLHEQNVPFVVRAAMLPVEKHRLESFEAWAKSVPWMDADQAPTPTLYLRCRGEPGVRDAGIRCFRLPASDWLAIEARDPIRYARGLKEFCSHFCRVTGAGLFGCSAGLGKANVDANGNLQLCLLLRHPLTVYNLRKGTLADAIMSFVPHVRGMVASDPRFLERCGRCFLRSLCEQCPGVSWTENRALDGWLEYFCQLTHAQARFIGLLQEGEKSWQVVNWEERVRSTQPTSNPEDEEYFFEKGK
jgi:radical SAM protein with 4Fe4S-binding SPASM domain